MMPSSEERLMLAGMLGDVMPESAQAAVSYVWSNAEALDIDPKMFEGKTIHAHVPAGAIPKDGPRPARRSSPRSRRTPCGASCAATSP